MVRALDREFNFTNSRNSEILAIWLLLCIETNYTPADKTLVEFMTTTGRRKFLIPLYKELIKQNQKDRAKEIFLQARNNYHPITYNSVVLLFD